MKYHEFPQIPPHLQLKVIAKCHPIPYVRLRQSCRTVDEFCETNRKKLGIYFSRKNRLLISHKDDVHEEDRRSDDPEYYLSVKSGRQNKRSDLTFSLAMENISWIRRSLSGFAFTHFIASGDYNRPGCKEYRKALELFLEIGGDFLVKNVKLMDAPVEQTKRILEIWAIDHLTFYLPDFQGLLKFDGIKKIPSISCNFDRDSVLNEQEIIEMARGKKFLQILTGYQMCSAIWTVMDTIFKNWEEVAGTPDTFKIDYIISENNGPDIYEQSLEYLPSQAVYFGRLPLKRRRECDLYVIPIGNLNHWRMLSIHGDSSGRFSVETAHSQEELAMLLIDVVLDHQCPYKIEAPLDFSKFYDGLIEARNLDGMTIEFDYFIEAVRRYRW